MSGSLDPPVSGSLVVRIMRSFFIFVYNFFDKYNDTPQMTQFTTILTYCIRTKDRDSSIDVKPFLIKRLKFLNSQPSFITKKGN